MAFFTVALLATAFFTVALLATAFLTVALAALDLAGDALDAATDFFATFLAEALGPDAGFLAVFFGVAAM
jgi:hypothetical protein